MKQIFKKLLVLLLASFCIFTFFGCKEEKTTYSLEVVVSSNVIYVDEAIELDVVVNPGNIAINDFTAISSDESVISIDGAEITGLKAGSATITVTATYESQDISNKVSITVKEEAKEYKLNATCDTSLTIGDSTTLEVKETVDNVSITDFVVFIEDEKVCKYESGKIVALGVGTTDVTITATYKDKNLSTTLSIKVDSANNNYSLSCSIPEELYVNQTVEVEVTLSPGDVAITDFTLTSSDEDVFYYYSSSKTGEAIEKGTATVTITTIYEGVEITSTFEVTVVGSLSLTIDYPKDITVGDEFSLTVLVNLANVTIDDYTISSNDINIISIEDNVCKALNVGNCKLTIRATYETVFISKTIDVTVEEYVPNSISSNLNDYLFVGEEKKVEVTLYPKNETVSDFKITSSNNSVIEVSNNKIVSKAVGSSNIVIEYTYENEKLSQEIVIEVFTFEGIEINIKDEIDQTEVAFYELIAKPSNKVIVDGYTYSSSDTNVLLVNSYAVFALKSNQTEHSTFTCTYNYLGTDYSASVEIRTNLLFNIVERISLTGSEGVLVGSTLKLSVVVYPSNGLCNLIYTSSDESIATVNYAAVVTPVSAGQCVITCSFTYDETTIYAKKNITVIDKGDVTEAGGGKYYESAITNYNELLNGVVQTTYLAYTSTTTAGIDADGYSGITETIVPGQFYSQQVNVLSVPSSTDTKIVPWANYSNNVWNLTTVKGLVENYENSHPGYKVIAAINGDFFDINANLNLPYQTTGENISDGEFYKTSNYFGAGGGTVGFTNNGSNISMVASGDTVRTDYMVLAVYDANGNIISEFDVQNLNTDPGDNETSVFFGIYNDEQNYVSQSVIGEKCYVINDAELALPNNSSDFYGLGTISGVSKATNLGVGQFAIKSNNPEVLAALGEGVRIRVQYEYQGDFANVTGATGYNAIVYEDVNNIPTYDGNLGTRAPRTVIGMKEDGTLIMVVIDGRQGANGMYGADGNELSAIMKSYGCVACYNLDGGGSSTMVIRTENGLQVLNSPSDGRERSDGNCILIVTLDQDYKATVSDITTSSATISVSTSVDEYQGFTPYIYFENEFYEVVDGKVELTNLVHNNTYGYQIYYKDGDVLYKTLTLGTFTTRKTGFKLLGITAEETNEAFIFKVYYSDIDKASNAKEMAITLNGLKTYFKDGTITLKKNTYGDAIDSVVFEYWYEDNGKTTNVVLSGDTYFKID